MSEPKIVEAVGKGRLHGDLLLKLRPNGVQVGIAKVRVQKVRDGKVYEDQIVEYEQHGFHG